MHRRGTHLAVWIALLLCGCDDLSEFKTGPHEVFTGEVIGSDSDPLAGGDSFIRRGFPSHTMLELRFNPDAGGLPVNDAGLPSTAHTVPGTVNTYVCPDGSANCAEADRLAGPFDHQHLLTIQALAHDSLSQYTFPGGGRLRNYIFGLHFTTQAQDATYARDAMVFVSLMETGQIELRAIAPSVLDADGETERAPALFGVFVLQRSRVQ